MIFIGQRIFTGFRLHLKPAFLCMEQLYINHPEYKVLRIGEAYAQLYDEFLEFYDYMSWDEFSDCCYAFNRLIGACFRLKYLRVLPFDGAHISKCNRRFLDYGHFRSKRHIIS